MRVVELDRKTVSNILVRRAQSEDIPAAAKVHELAFPRQTYSLEWLDCVFRSFPKSQLFVAVIASEIVGIIFWTEKSGFRKEAVVELEQIAVHPDHQDGGIGTELIIRSLPDVADKIAERGAKIGTVLGNTRIDNRALNWYKSFGAEAVATVPGMFSADEVFLVVHNPDMSKIAEQAKKAISKE
jgi:ribosomal protein S18 acetylase RimI-like enzyme